MTRKLSILTLGGFIVLLVTMALAPPAFAAKTVNYTNNANCSNAGSWDLGSDSTQCWYTGTNTKSTTKALAGDTARVGYTGYTYSTLGMNADEAIDTLVVGYTGGYSATVNQTGGNLTATNLYVGPSTYTSAWGTYNQYAGNNTVTTLYLGTYGTGTNTYNFAGGNLSVGAFSVNGPSATNSFYYDASPTSGTIDGAWTTLPVDNFWMGNAVGKTGTFTLGNGKTLTTPSLIIGLNGTGILTQNGNGAISTGTNQFVVGFQSGSNGTFNQNGTGTFGVGGVYLGLMAGSTGTYNFTAYGLNSTTILRIGQSGTGIMNIYGAYTTPSTLDLGYNAGSVGYLNIMQGGTISLNPANVLTNQSGTSYINYDTTTAGALGGLWATMNVDNFGVGYNYGNSGTFSQSAKTINATNALNTGTLNVGYAGTGNYTLTTGGTLSTNNIVIGDIDSQSHKGTGTMTYSGGTLTLTGTPSMYVGKGGIGTFNQLTNFTTPANFYIGNDSGSQGTYNINGGILTLSGNITDTAGTGELNINAGTLGLTGWTSIGIDNFNVGKAANGTLALSGTATQAITATNSAIGSATATGALTQSNANSTLNISNLTLAPSASYAGSFSLSSGIANIGNITGGSSAASLTQSGGTLNVSGNWNMTSGTFTPNTYTVNMTGASGTQTLNSGGTGTGKQFYHLTHSGAGTLQLLTNELVVTGNLVNSAGTFDANGLKVTVSRAATLSGGTYLAKTGQQTFNNNLTLSGGTLTADAAGITLMGNLTMTSGTLTAPTSATFGVAGNWSNAGTGTFTPGTGRVLMNKISGTQTLDSGGTGSGKQFNDLQRANGGTLQLLNNDLQVNGNFTNSAGGIFDANGRNITVGGNWSNSATFTPGTGTVTMNKASGTQTLNSGGTGSGQFNNLTHSGAGTLQLLTNDLQVNGNLQNSAGTFDTNARNVSVGSTLGVSGGTVNVTSGSTVTVSGTNNTVTGGTLNVNGSLLGSAAGKTLTVSNGGVLTGSGTIGSNTVGVNTTIGTGGIMRPGNSPGLTTVYGNFSNLGNIEFELGGATTRGTDYDAITVNSGNVVLNGVLQLKPWNGYSPASGSVFDLITWQNGYTFSGVENTDYALDYSAFTGLVGTFSTSVVGDALQLSYSEGPLSYDWNNAVGGDWASDWNWSDSTVPTSADDATINNGGTSIVSTAGAAANSVTIGSGTLDIMTGGDLSVTTDVLNSGDGTGYLVMNGGTLSVNGGMGNIAADNFAYNSGTVNYATLDVETGTFYGYFDVNSGSTVGTGTFYDNSSNWGTVGTATFNDYSNNYGDVGTATFNFANINTGNVSDNAYFYGSSYNGLGGTISGIATFNDGSHNDGSVTGDATFNGSSSNSDTGNVGTGTATFNESSHNAGTVGTGTFHNSSWNWGTVDIGTFNDNSLNGTYFDITGTVGTGYFYDSSVNSAVVTGDATFGTLGGTDTSHNNGSIGGTATFYAWTENNSTIATGNFYDHGSNWGTVTTGTFHDNSYNDLSGTVGTAYFYGASRNQGAVTGNATFGALSGSDTGYNEGTVAGTATFNASTWNASGTVAHGVFNDTSNNNGTVTNDATFNGSSYNNSGGNVATGIFNDSSYNTGAVTDATFNGTNSNAGTINETLTVSGSGTLSNSGTINVTDAQIVNGGTFTQSSGSLSSSGNIYADGTVNQGGGTVGAYILDIGRQAGSNAVYNLNGGTLNFTMMDYDNSGTSTLNLNGGTLNTSQAIYLTNLNILGSGSFTQAQDVNVNALGVTGGSYTQNSGYTGVNTDVVVDGGAYTQNGGTLNAGTLTVKNSGTFTHGSGIDNTVYGAVAVQNNGTLVVNGTLYGGGSNSVLVETGGTLQGSGEITMPVTVAAGSYLKPGNSPGLMIIDGDFTNSGTIEFELGGLSRGTEYDAINVNYGAASIGGTLQLKPWNGFTPVGGSVFDLVTVTGGSLSYTAGTPDASAFGTLPGSFTAAKVGNILKLTYDSTVYTWTNTGTGAWATGSNWDMLTPPTATKDAVINNSGTANVATSAAVDSLTIGNGTVNVNTGGTLNVASIVNTPSVTGTINMDGGTLNVTASTIDVDNFNVGNAASTNGSFTLASGKAITATTATIGGSGTGTVTQTGGSITLTDNLNLGLNATGIGTYNMSGGTLDITGASAGLDVGHLGTGTFNQSGGTVTIANNLYLGLTDISNSNYNLSGTGQLDAQRLVLGNGSTGTFTQTGGQATFSQVYMGLQPAGNAIYNLNGGTLNVATFEPNGAGTSTLNVNGGTLTVNGGAGTIIADTLTYNGGTVNYSTIDVATANIHNAMEVTTGQSITATTLMDITNTLTVSGGTVGGGNVVVNTGAVVQGYGTFSNTGTLTTNGKVIADGGGVETTLDMSSFTAMANTIQNATDNGYYAINKGKLNFSLLNVADGTNTYVVGGDLDLVHSVQFEFHDILAGGTLQVSLLDPTRSDIPNPPDGLVEYWNYESSGIDFGQDGYVNITLHSDPTVNGGQWMQKNPDNTWVAATVVGIDGDLVTLKYTHFSGSGDIKPVPEIPAGVALPLLALLGSAMVIFKKRIFAPAKKK